MSTHKTEGSLSKIGSIFKKRGSIVVITALVGLIFIIIGIFLEANYKFWSVVLLTIGTVIFVTISVNFLLQQFALDRILSDMKESFTQAITKKFDILETSEELGIVHIYPNYSNFIQNELPDRIRDLNVCFYAIGIGLESLAYLILNSHEAHSKMDDGKKFIFCLISKEGNPKSLEYRNNELPLPHKKVQAAVETALGYLQSLKEKNPERMIKIRTLKELVPKAVIICIDDKTIFLSPYLSSKRTPTSWVIEINRFNNITKSENKYYLQLKEEMQHILKQAQDING